MFRSDRPRPLLKNIRNRPQHVNKYEETLKEDIEESFDVGNKSTRPTSQRQRRKKPEPISDVEKADSSRGATSSMSESSDEPDEGIRRTIRGDMSKTNWGPSKAASSKESAIKKSMPNGSREERRSSAEDRPYRGVHNENPNPSKRRKLSDEPCDSKRDPLQTSRAPGVKTQNSSKKSTSSESHLVDKHGFTKGASTKLGYGNRKGSLATYGSSKKTKGSSRDKGAARSKKSPSPTKFQVFSDIEAESPQSTPKKTKGFQAFSDDDLDSPTKDAEGTSKGFIRPPEASPSKDRRAKFKGSDAELSDQGDSDINSPRTTRRSLKQERTVPFVPSSISEKGEETKDGKKSKRRQSKDKRQGSESPKAVFMTFDEDDNPDYIDAESPLSELGSDLEETQAASADVKEAPFPTVAKCPWCGDTVDEALFTNFSKGKRMNVRQQTMFCRRHKKQTAAETWKARSYPEIDWATLPDRMATHNKLLLGIIDGSRPSYYRTKLAEKIEAGQDRALKKEENLNPGYYGPRGFNLMCDRLVDRFGDMLKQKAVHDRIISGRGSAAFIQSVLVAELAVQLIKEDMSVSPDEARVIMEDSKALGEMVHEET